MRRTLITLLTLVVLAGGGIAIYFGIVLSQNTVAPDDTGATGRATCTGACGSGSECTLLKVGRNPSPGFMFSCLKDETDGNFYCEEEVTNGRDPDKCFLSCTINDWMACGCNVNACQNACLRENAGKTPGTYYKTDTCVTCGQLFTCSCEVGVEQPTNTPRPTQTTVPTSTPTLIISYTPSITPTVTPSDVISRTPTLSPTITVTGTITITPSVTKILPPTAIVGDREDKIILGMIFVSFGIWAYYYIAAQNKKT